MPQCTSKREPAAVGVHESRRRLALALAAIAALGVGALAAIAALDRDAKPRDAAAPSSRAEEPGAATVPGAPAAGTASDASPGQQLPAVGRPPAIPASPPPSEAWEALAPVEGAEALGDIGPAFAAALRESFGALGQCFEDATAARYASSGAVPTISRDSSGSEMRGPPVLLLEFETMASAVRIVDAPVGTRGTATDGVVLCAQSVLRGMRIDVPGARPGERYRMRYALVQ